jgi:hypothetical protein
LDSDFPAPVVAPLPISVGIHLPASLTEFVYSDAFPREQPWTINLGPANTKLFTNVFSTMFESAQMLEERGDPSTWPASLDAVIEPSVEAFEYSLPRQSKSDQYAVWIRYNVDIFGKDGQLVTNWPISAYGQTTSGGSTDAMARAAELAMRDAAATIALQFSKRTGITNRESLLKEFRREN